MRFKKIKVGDKIRIKYHRDCIDGKRPMAYREWTVEKIYSNHVLCVREGVRESFTYGELVELGYEPAQEISPEDFKEPYSLKFKV